MKSLYLAYKAYDIHELLCHAVAVEAGLYEDAGLSVTLLDATFTPDEALPENTFHAACGAALAAFLSGQQRKVIYVACDRPMFWLYGRQGVDSVSKLTQGRVATFAEAAPPASFLKKYLQQHGVAPGLLPCRDDTSRLGLLASNSVDGALISSMYLPVEVEARGALLLAFLGDYLRLPSTGLAVSSQLYQSHPQLVNDMVGVYQEAMRRVFDDDSSMLKTVLHTVFKQPAGGLDDAVEVVRHCYTRCGATDESVLQAAVDGLAVTMGVAARPFRELYELGQTGA